MRTLANGNPKGCGRLLSHRSRAGEVIEYSSNHATSFWHVWLLARTCRSRMYALTASIGGKADNICSMRVLRILSRFGSGRATEIAKTTFMTRLWTSGTREFSNSLKCYGRCVERLPEIFYSRFLLWRSRNRCLKIERGQAMGNLQQRRVPFSVCAKTPKILANGGVCAGALIVGRVGTGAGAVRGSSRQHRLHRRAPTPIPAAST